MKWFLLDMADESSGSDHLLVAIENFVPINASRDADEITARWLRIKAHRAERDVWLLVDGNTAAAYHTSELSTCVLSDGTSIVGLNVAFAAGHADHPGMGAQIVGHLVELAQSRNIAYITVDPFDQETARVWRRHGFTDSLTHAQEDPEFATMRLVVRV